MNYKPFQNTIWKYYRKNKRDFPWRKTTDGYSILVSEIMLQQTQTDRVIPKYKAFLKKFPNFKKLGQASKIDLLKEWQGLGYNRRVLNLKRTAQIVHTNHNGILPQSFGELDALPGIGPYTAGALRAFVYNKPAICIETNIRTVFIHFFFSKKKQITDTEILDKIEATLPSKNIREWYYALMDYGVMLKKSGVRNNTQSKHYTKQSPFKGSNREVRSNILKLLLLSPSLSKSELRKKAKVPASQFALIMKAFEKEGFVE